MSIKCFSIWRGWGVLMISSGSWLFLVVLDGDGGVTHVIFFFTFVLPNTIRLPSN